jgi:hypothetical protein
MTQPLRELAGRLGNPLAASGDAPTPADPPIPMGGRSVGEDCEPRSSLERKLRAAVERKSER